MKPQWNIGWNIATQGELTKTYVDRCSSSSRVIVNKRKGKGLSDKGINRAHSFTVMASPHILQTIHLARVYGGFRLYHLRLPQHNQDNTTNSHVITIDFVVFFILLLFLSLSFMLFLPVSLSATLFYHNFDEGKFIKTSMYMRW